MADFRVQAIDDLNHLYNARREVEGRDHEFQAFKATHKLVRLPNIVAPRERIARWLVLAIFVVLESTLNGLFFAEGAVTGIIGGVSQACVLSILNIGAAVLYGRYGLPLIVHVNPAIRVAGVFATLAYVAWAFTLNLFIGHYRDLFIQKAGNVAVADVTSRFMSAPADVTSLILVALGLGLGLFSVIDAVGLEDSYLGYGAIGRRRADAITGYADSKARCLAGLTERRNSAIDEMARIIELLRSAELDVRLAIDGRARLHRNYRAYLGHLAESYTRLLQRYHDANLRMRSNPAPSRFQRQPTALPFGPDPPEPQPLNVPNEAHAQVINRMRHFIKAINDEFEAAVRQYQTVAGLSQHSS